MRSRQRPPVSIVATQQTSLGVESIHGLLPENRAQPLCVPVAATANCSATGAGVQEAGNTKEDDIVAATVSNTLSSLHVVLDDGSALPKQYVANAFLVDSTQRIAHVAGKSASQFELANFEEGQLCDLRVKVLLGNGSTNIVLDRITVTNQCLRIVLPRSVLVRGKVVDEQGNPLACRVGVVDMEEFGNGAFACGPLWAGPCRLFIEAKGYAPVLRWLHVGLEDVDVGTVVMERGFVVSGRVVDPEHRGFPGVDVVLFDWPEKYVPGAENKEFGVASTMADGSFAISNVPRKVHLRLVACYDDDAASGVTLEEIVENRDIGTVVLSPATYMILQLYAYDGSPAHGVRLLDSHLMEDSSYPGRYEGRTPPFVAGFGQLWLSTSVPEDDIDELFSTCVVPCQYSSDPTNSVTVHLSKEICDKIRLGGRH